MSAVRAPEGAPGTGAGSPDSQFLDMTPVHGRKSSLTTFGARGYSAHWRFHDQLGYQQ
jgi:hypothetical protein